LFLVIFAMLFLRIFTELTEVDKFVLLNTFAASTFQPLHMSWQLHNSLGHCVEELFKPSKDLASFRICNEIKIFGFGFQIFL